MLLTCFCIVVLGWTGCNIKNRKLQEGEKNYIMENINFSSACNDQLEKELAWTFSVQVENEKCIQNCSWKVSRDLAIHCFVRKNFKVHLKRIKLCLLDWIKLA